MSDTAVQANTRTEQAGPRTWRRLLFHAAIVVFAVGAWANFAADVLVRAPSRPHWPDAAYWVAARLALEGRGALIYAGQDVFAQESLRLGSIPDIFDANMPTTVLPFLPFGLLPEVPAYLLWVLFTLLCFGVAWGVLMATLRLSLSVRLALWAVVPFFHPLRDNVNWGQVYPLVLLLLVAGAMLAARQEAPGVRQVLGTRVRAGLVFGLLCIVKLYYGLVLLIPALVRRQARLLGAAGAVFGAAALLTGLWWGPQTWGAAITWSIHWRERRETVVVAYQTVNSWLAHMLRYDATLNPRPLLNVPDLVGPLWDAAALVLVSLTVAALWRAAKAGADTRARQLLPFAAAVPLAHLLAPVANEYHFVLMVFPLLVSGVVLAESSTAWVGRKIRLGTFSPWLSAAWIALIGATLLLGADWPFNVRDVGRGEALLHYPRLYGTFLVWALILVLLWRTPQDTHTGRLATDDGR